VLVVVVQLEDLEGLVLQVLHLLLTTLLLLVAVAVVLEPLLVAGLAAAAVLAVTELHQVLQYPQEAQLQ
jgi:hypothetical protein